MNKLSTVTYGVISLVVVVILIFTVALPVIENSQFETVEEKQNTQQSYMSYFAKNVSTTITISDGSITIGDETFTGSARGSVAVLSENFSIYSGASSAKLIDIDNDLYVSAVTSLEISIVSGVASYSYSDTDYTTTLKGNVMLWSSTGDYGVFIPNARTVYVDRDSPMYITEGGKNVDTGVSLYYIVSGTPTKLKAEAYIFADGEYTDISDSVTITNTATMAEDGPYYAYEPSTALVKMTYTWNNQERTIDISNAYYASMIAPIAYHVTDSSNPIYMLLGVIPLVLTIVPIMLAVQLITGSRRD